MPLATLTTDCGSSGHFPAALKGRLLGLFKDITLVDITHEVAPGDTIGAAYEARAAAKYFPDGSVHLIMAGAYRGRPRPICLRMNDRFFLVPDNGLPTLLFPSERFDAYTVDDLDQRGQADWIEAFARLAEVVLSGDLSALKETGSYQQAKHLSPIAMPDAIRGSVFYTTETGNLVVNVRRDQFDELVGDDGRFVIQYGTYHSGELFADHRQVSEGEVACFFNDEGFLEIGLHGGSARDLLGFDRGSSILIERRSI